MISKEKTSAKIPNTFRQNMNLWINLCCPKTGIGLKQLATPPVKNKFWLFLKCIFVSMSPFLVKLVLRNDCHQNSSCLCTYAYMFLVYWSFCIKYYLCMQYAYMYLCSNGRTVAQVINYDCFQKSNASLYPCYMISCM